MAFPARVVPDRSPLPLGSQALRVTATNDRSVRHDRVAMRQLDNPNSYKKLQLDSGCEAHRHNLYEEGYETRFGSRVLSMHHQPSLCPEDLSELLECIRRVGSDKQTVNT